MLKWLWGKNGWDGCWGIVLGCVVALGVFLAGVIGGLNLLNAEGVFEKKSALSERGLPSRGIPVMEITLADGLELSEIDGGSKETKYEGNEVDLYEGGEVFEFDDVEVKGRGNGTWSQEKKPYQIKFSKKIELFDMGKARKWYLLANAMDETYLRTETAFYVEEMLGMDCSFEGESVELYVNGDYRGLYYLTRAVEISKDLVDLKDPMGILVELDNMYGGMEEHYETGNGDIIVVKDVVGDDNAETAMENFLVDYNSLEDAIKEKDYNKVKELIDTESFAQYYLLSEFLVNPDAYWTSFYMYKDGVNDKIHAGPGWDFDLALANRNWGNWMGEKFYSPMETMIRKQEILQRYDVDWLEDWQFNSGDVVSTLLFDLMEIPEFQEEVSLVFREKMAGRRNELIRVITNGAEKIYLAAKADGERWGRKDFKTELTAMLEWVKARYGYCEMIYGDGSSVGTGAI